MIPSFLLLTILVISSQFFGSVEGIGAQLNPTDPNLVQRCPMCQAFMAAASISEVAEIRTNPPRPFHANGGGAHGHFVVTHDITKYTKAVVYQMGKKTQVLARFSTNWGLAGSADIPVLPPDMRGFAVKFYSEDGNTDLVGGNGHVSTIRDIRLFAQLEKSRGRHLGSFVPDPNSWWNFTASHPETLMQTIQLFSDLAYASSWRYMDGIFPHAVKLVNSKDESVYAKFVFLADQKDPKLLTHSDVSNLDKFRMDYSKDDLYRAIEAGQFPSWTLYVQLMTFDQARQSKMNPFDSTKVWPRSLYPLRPVGKMVLDKNPENYQAEIEIAAFNPGCVLPGIEMSPDTILNARAFSYGTSHSMRLGAQFMSLLPNTMKGVKSEAKRKRLVARVYDTLPDVEWQKVWDEPNDFEQPREFYEGLSQDQKTRLAYNVATWLGLAKADVQELTVDLFANVSPKLAQDVKAACAKRRTEL